jgi:hypothetical protein
MISVLVGFFTIFIGVFMVNDAKATSSSLIERTSRVSRGSRRASRGEFVPLTDLDDPLETNFPMISDEIQSKYQNTRLHTP